MIVRKYYYYYTKYYDQIINQNDTIQKFKYFQKAGICSTLKLERKNFYFNTVKFINKAFSYIIEVQET